MSRAGCSRWNRSCRCSREIGSLDSNSIPVANTLL
eukprot:gene26519-biopygen16740